jgi:hypothetical protein
MAKTVASACLSFALSESIAPWLRGSEILAAILVMSVGLIVLDVLVAIFQDREFVRDLIRSKLGAGPQPPAGGQP